MGGSRLSYGWIAPPMALTRATTALGNPTPAWYPRAHAHEAAREELQGLG